MSGRRVYARFQQMDGADGHLCISRDVAVHIDSTSDEISVLSDSRAVLGQELTLALVSSAGARELRVKVVDSRPHLDNGVFRHLLRLQILAAGSSC